MAAQVEWLKARQLFLKDIKRQVQSRLGPVPKSFKSYIRDYESEFSRAWRPDSIERLSSQILRSKIVLGADFHAFSESQRIHLRILRSLPREKKVVIVLEALLAADRDKIDAYLSGRMSREQFLEKVKWRKRWGFPFENYLPIFELARERDIPIRGLSHPSSAKEPLLQRDRRDAKTLSEISREYPGHVVYVIIGDLHLAETHLPDALYRSGAVKSRKEVTRVLQNSEHLYFRLAKQRKEQTVEVMSSGVGRFCVLSSPPWVKWQSYLMYLEKTYDEEIYDRTADFTDCIKTYVRILQSDLKSKASLNRLDVVGTEGNLDLGPLLKNLSKPLQSLVRHSVATERSFYLYEKQTLWLARSSINHAATLAGLYLQSEWGGIRRTPIEFPKDLEALIWIEAIGYFSSKLINHKRKTETFEDLKRKWQYARADSSMREILRLALSQRLRELDPRFPPFKFKPKNPNSFVDAGRVVGQMHGEKMFALFSKGEVTVSTIKKWMSVNPFEKDFLLFYRNCLRKLNPSRGPS